MLDSVVAHASAEYEVVLYVDDDDASMADFHADAKIVRGPQRTLSDCWNACWWEASGDIFGMMGDDVVIESTDWDGMVRRAFEAVPDRIAFVYGTDGFRNGEHGSHGFVHRNWTDVVGRFVPPYFAADMCDTWLNDVAKAIDRRVYLPELLTTHLHPAKPSLGVEIDDTYRLGNERRSVQNQYDLYDTFAAERAREVDQLRGAMV
jgi:hypothetical protein